MKLFCLLDLENGGIPTEDEQVVNQLEEKLNAINKFATEAYNSVISNSQVVCFICHCYVPCPVVMICFPNMLFFVTSTDR